MIATETNQNNTSLKTKCFLRCRQDINQKISKIITKKLTIKSNRKSQKCSINRNIRWNEIKITN